MRTYADLHLCPPLDDVVNGRSMASLLAEVNTQLVGLVVPPERTSSTLPVADVLKHAGLDVARRLDLKPKSREELLRGLRTFRSKYEIISVECRVPSVSTVAVRDRRVDIVHFPKQKPSNAFRENLAKTCRVALEFNLSELISGTSLETRLYLLRREIETAADAGIRVIGSTNASNAFELRSPRDVAAVMHTFGLPLDAALQAVSGIPIDMVETNRIRLRESRLEEGVKVLRRSAKHE